MRYIMEDRGNAGTDHEVTDGALAASICIQSAIGYWMCTVN